MVLQAIVASSLISFEFFKFFIDGIDTTVAKQDTRLKDPHNIIVRHQIN